MGGWNPIETFVACGSPGDVSISDGESIMHNCYWWYDTWAVPVQGSDSGALAPISYKPTHWMPKLELPKSI